MLVARTVLLLEAEYDYWGVCFFRVPVKKHAGVRRESSRLFPVSEAKMAGLAECALTVTCASTWTQKKKPVFNASCVTFSPHTKSHY